MNNQANRIVRMAIVFVAVVCALCHVPRLNAQGKHLVTGDDLMSQMKYIDQLQLSPDGRHLAYVIGGEDSLWLLTTETKESHALGNGFIPRWSPDGTRLAFYSIRSGTPQLWIVDLKASQPIQITNFEGGINPDPVARLSGFDEEPLHYSWSPDGRRIVFTSRINSKSSRSAESTSSATEGSAAASRAVKPLVLTGTTPSWWTLSGLFKFDPVRTAVGSRDAGTAVGTDENYEPEPFEPNQLFVIDVESKKLEQLSDGDGGYFTPDWSPDGTEIVCISNEARPMTGYGPDTTNLYAMDLVTKKVTARTRGPGQKRLPTWSADGKWIVYLGGKQFEVASLYAIPGSGGAPVSLTQRLDRQILSFQWDSKNDAVFLSYQDGISVQIGRVAVSDRKLSRLTQADSFHFPFTLSRSNEIAWVESNGSTTGVVRQSDLDFKRTIELVEDLNPRIHEWALGEQEVVRWKNRRGEEIAGILIKPVGYQKGKAYPLIVDPYPGRANGFMGYLMSGNQAFASRGYAVFFPNERTAHTWWNPYKGKAFDEATRGPQGPDIMMDDLMSGIDTIVKMGIADPDRMCLYGFSNGGGATNMVVTRTTRFKCAVSASAAANDLTSQFFMLGDPETFAKEAGGRTPWSDPEAYVKLSPVYHLDKVTTPMLFAAGDQETAGTLINLEMYTGLRYLGRDATFLRYPDQGHGFTGEALKDYWQRVNAFFDKYLHPDDPLNQLVSSKNAPPN